MAKNTATKSIQFTFEGATYTLTGTPLEVANAKRTVEAARTKMEALVTKSVKRGRGRPSNGPKEPTEAQRIRAWASENGFEVGARGRLNSEVVEAYKAAKV